MRRRWIRWVLLATLVVFGVMQLVPYRTSNPSVHDEPAWDSPRTRALARVACFDCHSNETRLAWFERVAPVSWWIKGHVDEGRDALNLSEWSTHRGEGLGEAAETITNGSMPPDYYTWLGMHSDAKLTPVERRELVDGLRRTAAQSGTSAGG